MTLLRPSRALLHPLWIGALVLLLVNDRLLKGAGILDALATGKLSDFAGLLVAPPLLATLLRTRRRRTVAVAHLAVGLGFSALQLGPVAGWIEQLMAPLAWRIWPDPTDLLALPSLLLSWRVLVPAMAREEGLERRLASNARAALATVGLLGCLGTSSVPPETPEVLPPEPASADEAAKALSQLRGTWRFHSATGDQSYSFDGERYEASGSSYAESGRVQVLWVSERRDHVGSEGGQALRLRFYDRSFNGHPYDPLELTIRMAEDGESFHSGGRYVRVPDSRVLVPVQEQAPVVAEPPR